MNETFHVTTDDGVTLCGEATGQGTAIVFLHEFADDARGWAPQLRRFGGRYRCAAFNARGYPPSQVPEDPASYSQDRAVADVFCVMDSLGLGRVHLVGHSMGAYTALHAAMRAPDRVASVVAVGCGWGSNPRERDEARRLCQDIARLFRERPIAEAAREYASFAMRRPFRARDPEGWESFVARLAQHSATGSALTMLGLQMLRPTLWDMEAGLRAMRTPLLVVVGDEDEPCLEGSLFLKRTVPEAGLMVVPYAGHMIPSEAPDLFGEAAGEFLTLVESGRWMAHRASGQAAGGD
jgi:pimeloyl-ACP methyl ester carboxylesterase